MSIIPDCIADRDRHTKANFFNSLSGFKSANLLGTCDAQGHTNLALMSSVFHIGANPPLIGLLIRPHSVPRHSLENLMEQRCYTLNAVTESMYRQAHQSSARYPREVSEFDAVGLTPQYSDTLSAPFVAESPIKAGLSLVETQTLAVNDTVLVIGEVIDVLIDESLIDAGGQVDHERAGVVAVSGLGDYYQPQFLERVEYAKV